MKLVIGILITSALSAQTTAESIGAAFDKPLQDANVTAAQLRRHLVALVPRLARPVNAAAWAAEAARLRSRVLNDVVYHGWPREWVEAPPRFQDLGVVPAGKGYRLRKLRYEIVPGFYSSALLYEPETMAGRVPAILNVNGHEAQGKSMEYIQKRCINQARQGILALNLEWIGMGELAQPHNAHWFEAHLDFAGANGLGLFYLAMRRGLDWLWQHPGVDRARIGVTGLSGGGWQTIVLAALDDRVQAAVPNAGYLSNLSIGGAENVGDNEQSATDFGAAVDYAQLTAMRAPRPTLLIYNEEDNCCFRAPRMKPFLFDAVRPFFDLYNAGGVFLWHENTDPGDHNYQLDNRMRSYEFFARSFGLPVVAAESPAGPDVKTYRELSAGLPEDNLTIVGLAQKFAREMRHPAGGNPAAQRARLADLVQYRPADVQSAWPVSNSFGHGIRTIGWRFDFASGLSANGVYFEPLHGAPESSGTIVLDDRGKGAARAVISERVNRGEPVLAVDLLFYGDAAPPKFYYPLYDRMMATLGERSLGVEAAQLLGILRWLKRQYGDRSTQLETAGLRTQAVAAVAAALEPAAFSDVQSRDGLDSWNDVLAKPVPYQAAPELFCLDLYRDFDVDALKRLGRR